MIDLYKTKLEDIYNIDLRNDEKISDIREQIVHLFSIKDLDQLFLTLKDNKDILGIFWLITTEEHINYISFMPSKLLKGKHIRGLKNILFSFSKNYAKLVTVSKGNEKWHELIGFKAVRAMQNNKDFTLWEYR